MAEATGVPPDDAMVDQRYASDELIYKTAGSG